MEGYEAMENVKSVAEVFVPWFQEAIAQFYPQLCLCEVAGQGRH
jgi:hypothetical protein